MTKLERPSLHVHVLKLYKGALDNKALILSMRKDSFPLSSFLDVSYKTFCPYYVITQLHVRQMEGLVLKETVVLHR